MADHTPGPWEAMAPSKVRKHWWVGARAKLGGKSAMAGATAYWIVARIDNGAPGDTLKTEEANARLIAAAPELLEACQAALAYDREVQAVGMAGGSWVASPTLDRLYDDWIDKARAAITKATGQPAAPEGAR